MANLEFEPWHISGDVSHSSRSGEREDVGRLEAYGGCPPIELTGPLNLQVCRLEADMVDIDDTRKASKPNKTERLRSWQMLIGWR